jgi:hypothetical protein
MGDVANAPTTDQPNALGHPATSPPSWEIENVRRTQSAPLGAVGLPRTPIAVKVWYGDGTTQTITTAQLATVQSAIAAWQALPTTGVQFVTVYYDETYPKWNQDRWDEQGRPVNQRYGTENVVDQFHSVDFYWVDAQGRVGAGLRADLPVGLPNASQKRASALADTAWQALYNAAKEDRHAP